MATVNNGFGFFAAKVPVTPGDVYSTVLRPVETMHTQAEKAAHIRPESFNLSAAAVLSKCTQALNAAIAPIAAISSDVKGTGDEQAEVQQDDVSRAFGRY
jgi:hypothetical protein